jgi:hypothetical protein
MRDAAAGTAAASRLASAISARGGKRFFTDPRSDGGVAPKPVVPPTHQCKSTLSKGQCFEDVLPAIGTTMSHNMTEEHTIDCADQRFNNFQSYLYVSDSYGWWCSMCECSPNTLKTFDQEFHVTRQVLAQQSVHIVNSNPSEQAVNVTA